MSLFIPARLKVIVGVQLVLGFVLIGLIILAGLKLPPLLEQESDLRERIQQLENELIASESELQESQAAIQASEERINALSQQEAQMEERVRLLEIRVDEQQTLQRYLEQGNSEAAAQLADGDVEQAIELLTSARNASQTLRPRVYIQYVDDDQVRIAEEISAALNEVPVTVPGYEQLQFVAHANEFRFFKREEEAVAEEVYQTIANALPELDLQFVYVRGYEDSDSIRPNHFEVWLSAQSPGSPNTE